MGSSRRRLLYLRPAACSCSSGCSPSPSAGTDDVAHSSRPGCPTPEHCSNVVVEYPFGKESRCAIDERFHLSCTRTAGGSKLFLDRLEVTNISVQHNKVWVMSPISRQCYKSATVGTTFFGETMNFTSMPMCFPAARITKSSSSRVQ
jgi:hypothetical protein